MDFVRERREWEQRLVRRAPVAEIDMEVEGMEMEVDDPGGLDESVQQEEEEIEALAQYLVDIEDEAEDARSRKEGDQRQGSWEAVGGQRQQHQFDEHGTYGSDEEDYDQLFMEVISGTSQEGEGFQLRSVDQQTWNEWSGLDSDQPGSSMDLL